MPGMSNFMRNAIIDWYHRGQAHTPPATVYIELCSTAPTPGSPGTPLSGSGYARVAIGSGLVNWSGTQADASTAVSSGTSGVTSNNILLNYGTAATAWGTASHWQAYDAASGGNPLFYGEIVNGSGVATPRTISSGDPVSFPISGLRVQWL